MKSLKAFTILYKYIFKKELEAEKLELLTAYNAVQLSQEKASNEIDDLQSQLQAATTQHQDLVARFAAVEKENKVGFFSMLCFYQCL